MPPPGVAGAPVIDGALHDLPWPSLLGELRALAGEEARGRGLAPQDVEDAVQEACGRLTRLGVRRLPAILLTPERGRWLRILVRNVLHEIVRSERAWRRAHGREVLEVHALELVAALVPDPFEGDVDLSPLPCEDQGMLTLLRLGLGPADQAQLRGIDAAECARRMRWALLRWRLLPQRLPPSLGRVPGSLAPFQGAVRRYLARRMLEIGWRIEDIAEEFGTTPRSILMTLGRSETGNSASNL